MSAPAPFQVRVQVRWGDMDALGHVNNAAYFTYCEQARMAFFAALDVEAAPGQGPALVTASLSFRRQVSHPADLDVELRVSRVGSSSFTLEYELRRDAEVVADGSSVVVWTDYAASRSVPLPAPLRAALEPYRAAGSPASERAD